MPIDLEMLLSAADHTFFPYSGFNTSDYDDDAYDRSLSFPQNHRCRPRTPSKNQGFSHRKCSHGTLAINFSYKSKDETTSTSGFSYGTRKKKVSFADDRGFKLVEVREIPGAPKWADDVLTLLIGSSKRSVVKEKKWKIAFEYPPWPDEKLVKILQKNMVALESISVKEGGTDDVLYGTVKVQNLAFEKSVLLRITFDRWMSYVDVPCTYIKSNEKHAKSNTFDTFYFNTKILPVASRYEVIEFCICFKCNDKEFWDNNGGINYRLVVEYLKNSPTDLQQPNIRKSSEKLYLPFSTNIENTVQTDFEVKVMQTEHFW